ncbi:hypothetical protein FRC06_008624, partial [Ceratobasidium sp. 370]
MKSLLLLSLASVASASSASSHIPLVRRARSGVVTPESLAAQLEAVDSKYGRLGGKRRVKQRQTNSGVPLVNQAADTSYYGVMNVGTPPAPYGVALDTGSSDLWFQSDSCTSCTQGVKFRTTSTSLNQSGTPFSITYGSGSVGGQIASDVVQMGGFTVQNQVMGLVNQTTGVLLTGQTAGLLGLAFQFLSNTQSTPFWEALVSGGQWTQPLMSFWMTRLVFCISHLEMFTNVTSAREEEYGGEFRMGGTNTTLYTGDIEYHDMPATVHSYWMIPLRQISINGGQPIIITNLGVTSLAAIDTGTTLIGGPPDIVANIYKQIPGSQRGTGNMQRYWVYPCDQAVTITFNFDGRAWPMAPADFQLLTNDPSLCVGSIFEASLGGLGNPDVPQWIVGDAFLKNVYSVFRYNPPSIGFAQLSAFAASGGVGQVPPNAPTSPTAPLTNTPGTLPPSATITTSASNTIAPAVSNALTCLAFLLSWPDSANAGSVPGSLSSASLRYAKPSGVLDFEGERKALLQKYRNKFESKGLSRRQGVVQANTTNQNTDILYYATIQVGTPPQSYGVILGQPSVLIAIAVCNSFSLTLDTGSSDLWLQSTKCAPCTGMRFDPAHSSSLKNSSTPFAITYGIGSVKGSIATDSVSIGSGSSSFTVQHQVLGLVNYTNSTPVPGNITGLMGLGFK